MTDDYKAKVATYKVKAVDEMVRLFKEYPIIGIVDMANLPTQPLQQMRERLRGKIFLKMTKKRIARIALEKVKGDKKGIEALEGYLRGMPAFMFTKENPFSIFQDLKASKSKAPAKGGQIAPNDIIIPAGQTPFAPGPIIGELGALGLKTGVEDGKVAVKEGKVVVKEGDVIEQKVAEVLTRLSIQPMEVGLNLLAVFEDGNIIEKSVLDIDVDGFKNTITQAHQYAFNLSMEAGIINDATVEVLLSKAHNEAMALAISQAIITADTAGNILALAEAHAGALKAMVK
ncbi:MAG: 50S ribosomal protein L10 [archaeon]